MLVLLTQSMKTIALTLVFDSWKFHADAIWPGTLASLAEEVSEPSSALPWERGKCELVRPFVRPAPSFSGDPRLLTASWSLYLPVISHPCDSVTFQT